MCCGLYLGICHLILDREYNTDSSKGKEDDSKRERKGGRLTKKWERSRIMYRRGKYVVAHYGQAAHLQNVSNDGERGNVFELPDAAYEDGGEDEDQEVVMVAPTKGQVDLNHLNRKGWPNHSYREQTTHQHHILCYERDVDRVVPNLGEKPEGIKNVSNDVGAFGPVATRFCKRDLKKLVKDERAYQTYLSCVSVVDEQQITKKQNLSQNANSCYQYFMTISF